MERYETTHSCPDGRGPDTKRSFARRAEPTKPRSLPTSKWRSYRTRKHGRSRYESEAWRATLTLYVGGADGGIFKTLTPVLLSTNLR